MRRRAERRTARDGGYFTVPEPGDLTAWETAALQSNLGPTEKRVIAGTARLIRRAIIVDGAKPGDRLWIGYDDLAEVS